jgi:membrane fusion protein, multidrug efflux system
VAHGVQRTREGDRVRVLGVADDETTVRDILEENRGEDDA